MKKITADNDNHPYLYDNLLEWEYGNTAYYSALVLLLLIAADGWIIQGDLLRAQWGFVALAIALLPALAEYLTPLHLPWPMKFFITLSLIFHIAGAYSGSIFPFTPFMTRSGTWYHRSRSLL